MVAHTGFRGSMARSPGRSCSGGRLSSHRTPGWLALAARHSAELSQARQVSPVARQIGRVPPQPVVLVDEHSPHEPANRPLVWQAGIAGSGQLGAPSPMQATQVWESGRQYGVSPEQARLSAEVAQVLGDPAVSQNGSATGQSASVAHASTTRSVLSPAEPPLGSMNR